MDFYTVYKKVQKLNQNPDFRKAQKEEIYKNRWKYFLTMPIFLAVASGFLFLGYRFKEQFFSLLYYRLWMIFCGFLLVGGILTWFYYLWIIVKGKR